MLYGIHGEVRDFNTGKPIAAKVSIYGHDKDNSDIYSDSLTGKFIRMLEYGFWNLTLSANGYRDTLITGILVRSGKMSELLVEMRPEFNPVDTTNPLKPLLYPNPASNSIKAVLPESIRGAVNIKIISQAGVKISDYNTEAYYGLPVIIDVSRLAGGNYIAVFTNRVSKISFRTKFIVIRHF